MKTGRSGPSITDYDVKLPQEIIAVIVSWIRRCPQDDFRNRTLWSCCLLSKSWYSAAIPYLYEAPCLSNKNFDKFARTICPPVNSHVRRIGLESFIRHLNMGHLAYESSKSLTARLLRRTRASLEIFVAPAVSFSVTCLAPLSKCHELRSLDLSRDHYDIDLVQLLNAVRSLPHLTALSLPRSAMRRRSTLNAASSGATLWPKNLTQLQINDCLPQDLHHWQELMTSFPESLTLLAFEDCLHWMPFFQLHQSEAVASHVRSLRIGIRREQDGFPIEILLIAFPGLTSLALPTPVGVPEFATTVSDLPGKGEGLQQLTFRPAPDIIQPRPRLTTAFLSKCVEIHKNLTKIEVPEAYLELDDESADDLDKMDKLMSLRCGPFDKDVGVYLTED